MPPTDESFTELAKSLKLVRDQVDELQIQAQEKRKPWYRQTPSLPSLLALLLSIATAFYSAYERQKQDVHGKKEELRRLITGLVDLNMEGQAKTSTKEAAAISQAERDMITGALNRKRMVYLEDADNIVRQIPKHVSSSAYDILATEMSMTANPQAVVYFEQAIRASKELFTKIVAVRNFGSFYALRSPFHDMEKARERFKQAVALMPDPRDEGSLYTLGFTWELWGTAEAMNRFPAEAREKYEKARACYTDLSNPFRQRALDTLEEKVRNALGAGATLEPPAIPLPVPSVSPPPLIFAP